MEENTRSKRDIAKMVTSLVVGAGVSKIVAGVIQNNTAPAGVRDKVTILAGAFVLGGIAADASRNYTNRQIDLVCNLWTEHFGRKTETETEPEPSDA